VFPYVQSDKNSKARKESLLLVEIFLHAPGVKKGIMGGGLFGAVDFIQLSQSLVVMKGLLRIREEPRKGKE